MQCALIEYARNVAKLEEADSTEFNPDTSHKIFVMLQHLKGVVNMGGTMRLGAYPAKLDGNSVVRSIYGQDRISERHRHRYEVNIHYRDALEKGGLVFSGMSPDGELPEIVEIPDHPWFIGVQYHPELKSKPFDPHPLFTSFIRAALDQARLV